VNWIVYFMILLFKNNIGYDGMMYIFAVLNIISIVTTFMTNIYKDWISEKRKYDEQ